MHKACIIIADSNTVGVTHKMVMPIVKHLYIKDKYQIVNPYRESFDPMISVDIKDDAITKAYKHALKTSDEIHIITNSHLEGVSPALEGFFERVLTSDFAYSRSGKRRSSRIKSKDAYFYVVHNTKRFKYGPLWFRLKFFIGRLFKSSTVYQIYPEDILKAGKNNYQKDLKTKILNRLNKNRS